MKQQLYRAYEQTKSKQKQNQVTSHSNWPSILLFQLGYKQWSGIIKGWLHCLTSESKGRYLVNNVLFGSAWCLVMAQIQFSLLKKIKTGRPEHLLTPLFLRPITSHFCLTTHLFSKLTSYVYHSLPLHIINKLLIRRTIDKAGKITIKAHILLWKAIEGNSRLRVRGRVWFLLIHFELAPTDLWCNILRDFTWTEKIWGDNVRKTPSKWLIYFKLNEI